MRLKHCLTSALCVLAVTAGGLRAFAQQRGRPTEPRPLFPSRKSNGYPQPMFAPAMHSAPAGPDTMYYNAPAADGSDRTVSVLPPGGPQMGGPQRGGQDFPGRPWPGVSPFDYRYSQHSIDNGFWMWEGNNKPNRYYWGATAMFLHLRKPERALVGNKGFRSSTGTEGSAIDLNGHVVAGDAQLFDKNFKTEGIQLWFGVDLANKTGMEFRGWWASDVTNRFKIGQDINLTNAAISPPIPVDNGTFFGGIVQYDRFFEIAYVSQAWNAQALFNYTPWIETHWLKIRPVWGFRYTYVAEDMLMHGADASTGTLFSSFLNTRVRSHMVGPEFGLFGEMGSKSLKIIGGSSFILYANNEKLKMEGDNFGPAATVVSRTNNDFSQTAYNTHVSPGWEGKVHFELAAFKYIPYLKNWRSLERAYLRGGFTYFIVGEVARPGSSIIYRGQPLIPELKTNRSKWHATAFDLGLHWEY